MESPILTAYPWKKNLGLVGVSFFSGMMFIAIFFAGISYASEDSGSSQARSFLSQAHDTAHNCIVALEAIKERADHIGNVIDAGL